MTEWVMEIDGIVYDIANVEEDSFTVQPMFQIKSDDTHVVGTMLVGHTHEKWVDLVECDCDPYLYQSSDAELQGYNARWYFGDPVTWRPDLVL